MTVHLSSAAWYDICVIYIKDVYKSMTYAPECSHCKQTKTKSLVNILHVMCTLRTRSISMEREWAPMTSNASAAYVIEHISKQHVIFIEAIYTDCSL